MHKNKYLHHLMASWRLHEPCSYRHDCLSAWYQVNRLGRAIGQIGTQDFFNFFIPPEALVTSNIKAIGALVASWSILSYEIQELWPWFFGNISSFHLTWKMHRIVPASPTRQLALSTWTLLASSDCLSAWLSKIILEAILIWPGGTRTSSSLPSTWKAVVTRHIQLR